VIKDPPIPQSEVQECVIGDFSEVHPPKTEEEQVAPLWIVYRTSWTTRTSRWSVQSGRRAARQI